MENNKKSSAWNSIELSPVLLCDSNSGRSSLLIGGQATGAALRMCQYCTHHIGEYYCATNCAEYQNMVGKALNAH